MAPISRLTPSPGQANNGRMNCAGSRRVSRTRFRSASVARRRRRRWVGKGISLDCNAGFPALPLPEVVVVAHELGIGAGAELVEVQALAFALGRHALRVDAVEQPVESVDQRQYEADKRGNPGELREPLARRRAEEAGGQNAPNA